jgi:hypothetical protein
VKNPDQDRVEKDEEAERGASDVRRLRGPEVQRLKGSEVKRFEGTEVQKLMSSEDRAPRHTWMKNKRFRKTKKRPYNRRALGFFVDLPPTLAKSSPQALSP